MPIAEFFLDLICEFRSTMTLNHRKLEQRGSVFEPLIRLMESFI